MQIRRLQAHDNGSYSALWAKALKEQDAFFRISHEVEAVNFGGLFVDEYQMVYFLKARNDLK